MEKRAKKVFSGLGLRLILILVIGTVVQMAVIGAVGATPEGQKWMTESSFGILLLSLLPLDLVAYPLGIWFMNKFPSFKWQKNTLSMGELFSYVMMGFPIMYLGNIIGTLLSGFVSGGQAVNGITELLGGNVFIEILFLVIMGPFFEELIFRKVIIDKTAGFSEKTAVVFSALTFGLFHGNFFQFFYSFGLGFMLGYIYIKTRKLSYVFGIHAIFNFIGGIVPSLVFGLLGEGALEAIVNGNVDLLLSEITAEPEKYGVAFLVLGIYYFFLLTANIAGIIFFFVKRKNFVLSNLPVIHKENRGNGEEEYGENQWENEAERDVFEDIIKRETLEEEEADTQREGVGIKTACLNLGMILFFLLMTAVFIFSLLGA